MSGRHALPVIQDARGQLSAPSRSKPDWLKIRPPGGPLYAALKSRARRLHLATVCEEAQCPNLSECWTGGTATFMLMGEVCTRGCRFCAVQTAKVPPPLDHNEPLHVAEAVAEMGLSYVVITSVNRDELPDGGSSHLAACLEAIRETSTALIEVLIPDFQGDLDALDRVLAAPIAVLAHNVETVERLTASVRDPRASYAQSLEVLDAAKRRTPRADLLTKSSVMLGLGETGSEVEATLVDLRSRDVDIVTLGQYLRPSSKHLPVVEYLHPETFDRYAELARSMGFRYVASGPLVRSSYRAGELFVEGLLQDSPSVMPPPGGRDHGLPGC